MQLTKIDEYRFLIPRTFQKGMNVEGLIYANDRLISAIESDETLKQVANVATLPGLVGRSLAMPDAHQGYGFAIGGVAASDIENGIVSAGGVGFDINCGVRLMSSEFDFENVKSRIGKLLDQMFRDIPCGTGRSGIIDLSIGQLDNVLKNGCYWAVENNYGNKNDVEFIEEKGRMTHADPSKVSDRAKQRGKGQLGTLGSGNHFIEVQYVAEIFDEKTASIFGLHANQVVVMIHSGSRGLGHQVCTDYLEVMQEAMPKYGIKVVDRQLACVPVRSDEGQDYLKAMAAAANYAFSNRQIMGHWTSQAFDTVLGNGNLRLIYDVAHNIAKEETHRVGNREMRLLVHRKGATRAFPKNHKDIPVEYFEVGQPVLIPGSMGTSSYVLVGTERAMLETFGSACHGAGRAMSRHAAKKDTKVEQLISLLKSKGVDVRGASKSGLAEEKPEAYKDVDEVVDVVHNAGIAAKVARMVPVGVIKG